MKKYLFSFDGTESVVAECIQPYSIEAVKDNKFFTPYGAVLSYCGAALEHTGTIIQSTLYSKIIEFDPENNFMPPIYRPESSN